MVLNLCTDIHSFERTKSFVLLTLVINVWHTVLCESLESPKFFYIWLLFCFKFSRISEGSMLFFGHWLLFHSFSVQSLWSTIFRGKFWCFKLRNPDLWIIKASKRHLTLGMNQYCFYTWWKTCQVFHHESVLNWMFVTCRVLQKHINLSSCL